MAKSGGRSPSSKRIGAPPKVAPEKRAVLIEIIRKTPTLSLEDLAWAFREATGISISAPTAKKYLLEAGFHRSRAIRSAQPARREPEKKVYGYHAAHRDAGDAVRYPCGLTDSEWEQVRPIFDPPGRAGRPAEYSRRQMLDACIYVLRSGCSWRMLPKDMPPWGTVYQTFRRWQAKGKFEAMYDQLRALWRSRERKRPEATGAVLDSQSVKTSAQGGPKGYDAGKKVKGRKRNLVTDTLGLLIAVLVTTASTQDRDAALPVLERAKAKMPSLQMLYVDNGYTGKCANAIREGFGMNVEVVRHPVNRKTIRWDDGQLPLFQIPQGFVVLPKRWVVERTNAWIDRPRRMSKDHDRDVSVSEAWIWLAEGRRLLRRLVTINEPQMV